MHTLNRSNLVIALTGFILLCTGCAKRTKIVLPPLKKPHFEATKEGVTLKVRELNEQELKEINTKGLGSYKIGRMPLNKKDNRHNRSKYVRVLYGTLINEASQPITFSRRSISLPVLPPHKAYRFSNNLMIWSFVCGMLGIAGTAWGLTMLFAGPQAGASLCTIGGSTVLCVASANTFNYTCYSALCIELTILGFLVGIQEVEKEKNLKYFTRDTMLSDALHTIQPQDTQSWLMVVRSHKYRESFVMRCMKPDSSEIAFDVTMPDTSTF